MRSGDEVGFDYPNDQSDFEQDDFWCEEDYLEETAAEALARMTPAEKAADRLYCQLLEEWLVEDGKR